MPGSAPSETLCINIPCISKNKTPVRWRQQWRVLFVSGNFVIVKKLWNAGLFLTGRRVPWDYSSSGDAKCLGRPCLNVFFIGIVGGGVQLGPLGTAATNRPTVPAPGDYDDGEIGGMIGRRIFSSPRRPDRLWGPPNLLFNGYSGLFPRG
jgi:hypothetical protein